MKVSINYTSKSVSCIQSLCKTIHTCCPLKRNQNYPNIAELSPSPTSVRGWVGYIFSWSSQLPYHLTTWASKVLIPLKLYLGKNKPVFQLNHTKYQHPHEFLRVVMTLKSGIIAQYKYLRMDLKYKINKMNRVYCSLNNH